MSKWGTRTPGEARVIRTATARGWVRLERTGGNHVKLCWPPTGQVTQIPSSMDDRFARAILRKLAKMEKQA